MSDRGRSRSSWTLTIITVIGLVVDAYVHFHLAHAFARVKTSTLSQADLFRVEATVALIVAVALLLRPRRYTAGLAFLVAAGGLVAVVLYRYVNVGAFGPIPNMYDPFWGPAEKTLSAIAEAAAAVTSLVLFMRFGTRRMDSTIDSSRREDARLNG